MNQFRSVAIKSIANHKRVSQSSGGKLLWLLPVLVISLSIAACSPSQVGLPDEISVSEAHQLYQDGVFFLDVRTQEEWDDFHAPNTTHIPLDQLESRYTELPMDEEIVVVCRSGNRSQTGRDILRDNGFVDVTSMAGGLNAWQSAGYPIE